MGSRSYIRARFRSWDLWVMGPPRFRCATLIVDYKPKYILFIQSILFISFAASGLPESVYPWDFWNSKNKRIISLKEKKEEENTEEWEEDPELAVYRVRLLQGFFSPSFKRINMNYC